MFGIPSHAQRTPPSLYNLSPQTISNYLFFIPLYGFYNY